MDQKDLRELENHCIQECAPWCSAKCPVHVDVRAMADAIGKGDFDEAVTVLRKKVPFPGIISLICDHPCQDVCRRKAIDSSVSIRSLERAALANSAAKKAPFRKLPGKGKKVAVVGAGLSGLTAALELTKKGHKAVVFEESDRPGGSVWDHPESELPRDVIEADLQAMVEASVEIRLGKTLGKDFSLSDLVAEYDAVYLGTGPGGPTLDLETDEHARVKVDPTTFQTSHTDVFAGGSMLTGADSGSPIGSISDGRRAAISIDRHVQKVSLRASRENEGPYDTRLFTSIEGKEVCPPVTVADPMAGLSAEEAAREAVRCLQCECMECVKVCEYLAKYKAYPRKYLRQIYNNLSIVSGHRQGNLMINSCSICGLCKEVCPEDLHMGLVCKSARELMVDQKRMPPSAHEFALRDMEFSLGERFALARNEPGRDSSAYLFFPGCQLSASSPDNVKKAYSYLRQGLDGGVGIMLRCCGAPADWSGRKELFSETFAEFKREWERLGSPKLVTACATCAGIFSERLPSDTVISLWEVKDNLGLPELDRTPEESVLALHDPCTSRHQTEAQKSVRNILEKLGCKIGDVRLSGDLTECCGFGGLMCFADRDLAERVVTRRIDSTPHEMVAYCAMCRDRFAYLGKPTRHLLDLIFGVDPESARGKGPDYSQRRENRFRLKRSLLDELWNEVDGVTEESYQDIKLNLSDEVRDLMERRMILVEDVQQVLQWAEKTGRKLVHRESGMFLAHYRPGTVTYWVEYSPVEDGYRIHNVYSHRMHVEEGLDD